MEPAEDVPDPIALDVDSGVSGTQTQGAEVQKTLSNTPPLEGVLLKAVVGIATSRPKSFGGDVNAKLLAGIMQHFTDETAEAKATATLKEKALDQQREKLSEANIETAILKERLDAATQNSRRNQWTGIIGTALIGAAIDLYKSNLNISYLVGLLGAIIVALPLLLNKSVK